ncbi:MAG: hypothetical protein ABWY09_02185 [Stenotrophomonas maltophilia]
MSTSANQFRIAVLCTALALGTAWAQPLPAESNGGLEEVTLVAGVQNGLRHALGTHYARFSVNFEQMANPVRLKDGGILIDGWKKGHPNTHAAAFVYYADGRVHAAYYDEVIGQVFYSDASDGKPHPALRVWAGRFSSQAGIKRLPEPSLEAFPSVDMHSDMPSDEDQAALRSVAASIWSSSQAANWNMNVDVGDILGTVTKEIIDCSAAFGLVPKPVGWVPGWSYIAKSAGQVLAYILGVSAHNTYRTCVVTASLSWRTAIEIASAEL